MHESVGGVVKEYIYAQDGQELSVVDASQNLLQGETYFGGRYLATVGSAGTSYAHTDWLGTVRARTGPAGALAGAYTSGPFGENLSAIGGASSLHLTGKYRDGETGFDYFGARYYNSSLGRFLTPDWSQAPAAVPYANLENPQSLNLYAYVQNNPASAADAEGHCLEDACVGEGSFGVVVIGTAIAIYLGTPYAQRSLSAAFSSAYSEVADRLHSLLHASTMSGPRAASAPGVTAGGQATDLHGNKLGPSGKPQVNETESNTREAARNKALGGGNTAVEHSNPKTGRPHFHPADESGKKKPNSAHHNHPG